MDPKYTEAFKQLDLSAPSASWEQVRTSYRRKVQRLHPDRVQHPDQAAANQEEFIRVTRAYKLLNQYHRENSDLPRDYKQDADPAMQVDLGSFDKIRTKDLARVVESIEHKSKHRHAVLKVVLLSGALAMLAAVGLLSFASWQKSQIAPITPFTSAKPLPLSNSAVQPD